MHSELRLTLKKPLLLHRKLMMNFGLIPQLPKEQAILTELLICW
jgi:hypothetical protein